MKTTNELLDLIRGCYPCPQGKCCTTGCTHGFAQLLIEKGITEIEFYKTLELINDDYQVDYLIFVWRIRNKLISDANLK